jgi:hypothetical protein
MNSTPDQTMSTASDSSSSTVTPSVMLDINGPSTPFDFQLGTQSNSSEAGDGASASSSSGSSGPPPRQTFKVPKSSCK